MGSAAAYGLPRALARADAGKTLNADEAATLLLARGSDLQRLLSIARRIRDAAFGEQITYSRKVFIPLTHLCRDACGYCTFAWPPKGDLPAYMSVDDVLDVARRGAAAGCREALFTLGDKPELRYPAAQLWLEERGYATTLQYVRAAAIAVIEQTGLIPHLNPGVLTWSEMASLKQVSGSMGLMLESTSRALLEKGGAHHNAPDKDPAVRLQMLTDAGKLSIPFTSGLLIGIGETAHDRAETLLELRAQALRYGHLQEVIVQNFRAKPDTAMRDHPEPGRDELLATVAVARIVLPTKVHVQAPPNLSPDAVVAIANAGVDDWGGVSPVTPDHVNPERPWPHLDQLAEQTTAAGKVLVERLCLYPEYVVRPDPWLAGRMRGPVLALAGPDGLADPGVKPKPMPWQDPEQIVTGSDGKWRGAVAGQGVTGFARETLLREDAEAVYGDSTFIAAEMLSPRSRTREVPRRHEIRPEVAGILRRAEAGAAPDEQEALLLFDTAGPELRALCDTADAVRAQRVGEVVTYVVNRNINFTNICYTGCRFCAFAQRRDDRDAYFLSLDQVADRAEQAWDDGATEICMQGGIHPDLGGDFYFDLVRAVKARVPDIHIHAFSPMEVVNGATRLGISVREWLTEAKTAGLDTIPGTAAEILDDEVRWVLTKGKLPAEAWVDVVTTAHRLGIRSSSTMMFGHVDEPHHWAAHLHLLRRLQLGTWEAMGHRSGGFTEFVPLPFVHRQAPIYLAGLARPGPDFDDVLRVHAVARLVLQGVIDNVQLSWVKVGLEGATALLQAGANDLGGTLMEETISRMAGADHGVRQDPETLRSIARSAGRTPAERTTDYSRIEPGGVRYLVAT